jgi:hypothetical protein
MFVQRTNVIGFIYLGCDLKYLVLYVWSLSLSLYMYIYIVLHTKADGAHIYMYCGGVHVDIMHVLYMLVLVYSWGPALTENQYAT